MIDILINDFTVLRTQNSEIIYLTQLLYKRFHIYIFKCRYFDGLGRHLVRQNFVAGTDVPYDRNFKTVFRNSFLI